ncbi:MAG: glycosyltransferase [Pseudomonadota bacterium]
MVTQQNHQEKPLKILITNNTLNYRAGSELYVRDLASALAKHGHAVSAYSNVIGPVGQEIRALGIPVLDSLSQVPFRPDIIHGQHHLETMTALFHFSDVPAVYFCHGFVPWEEIPPTHPRIILYAAVDEPTRLSCIGRYGTPRDRTRLILNFVDLDRFTPRSPLPRTPHRALVFSNQAREQTYVSIVREACIQAGLEVNVAGAASGSATESPETLLGRYDIVFAKARCALEALAVGTAVVLCDEIGIGPMVSTDSFHELRQKNFGRLTLDTPFSVDALRARIEAYNAEDAAEVSLVIRSEASLEGTLPSIVDLYRQAIAGGNSHRTALHEESLAAARYVRMLSDSIKNVPRHGEEPMGLWKSFARQAEELDSLRNSFSFRFRERLRAVPVLRSLVGGIAHIGRKWV